MERVAVRRTSVSVEAWSRSSSASYTCRDFIPEEPMRRVVFTAALVVLVASVIALAPSTPPSAQGPITLSVIDVSGDLSSTRVIIENYQKANPQKIKAVNFQRAPAPELPAKIKAQQDAGRVDVNLLLVGQDAGSVLASNGQLVKLFPQYDALFPRDELSEAGKGLQAEGEGVLLPSVVSNGGPRFFSNPPKAEEPPKTAPHQKGWGEDHHRQLACTRPAHSPPRPPPLLRLPL